MGGKAITDAGVRYVCTPLPKAGRGVQHIKIVLLAGPQKGRLLVGSGNLTMHGFGRNLELFSSFEYISEKDDPENAYPFKQCWSLLSTINANNQLPKSAANILSEVREKATWINDPGPNPENFQLWHSHQESIWDQLQTWRQEKGFSNEPLEMLQVISPYYDGNLSTAQAVSRELALPKLQFYLSRTSTNIDGAEAVKSWQKEDTELEVFDVTAKKSRKPRDLHAKALIGFEKEGCWMMSGSSNFTQPGLMRPWNRGGNLEMVTLNYSPSVSDLTIQDNLLYGKIENKPMDTDFTATLEFLHSSDYYEIEISKFGEFSTTIDRPFEYADAAKIVIGEHATPYRWIDFPISLQKYGQRLFRSRLKTKIESLDGARSVFKELMDFLWNRVDPTKFRKDSKNDLPETGLRTSKRKTESSGDSGEDINDEILPASRFITEEELIDNLNWGIDNHPRYDRNIIGLRDLLSIVLLRLATETRIDEVLTPAGETDEDTDQERTAEQEEKRITALQWIRRYILSYCRRYARRLADKSFVESIGSSLLFQNHLTLGRILVELFIKTDAFTQSDLETCFWWIWAPMVNPDLVGVEGEATLIALHQEQDAILISEWHEAALPELLSHMIYHAFNISPGKNYRYWQKEAITKALILKQLLLDFEKLLGEEFINLEPGDRGFEIVSLERPTSLLG
jgi:hypothetical protein